MNRKSYLARREVHDFINWLIDTLPLLNVSLCVSKQGTGRGGPGAEQQVKNFRNLVDLYCWHTKWTDQNRCEVRSSDWTTTALSLGLLQTWIKSELASDLGTERLLNVARAVAQWGGDRNPKVGMIKFVESLDDAQKYFSHSRCLLSLKSANLSKLNDIKRMNSMLTKFHSLMSDDGLPIYDSRVAGAIGALVEIYRQQRRLRWPAVPDALRFRAPYRECRRQVKSLWTANTSVVDPGVFSVSRAENSVQRASAKIRLGWIMDAVLERNCQLKHPILNSDIERLDRRSQMRAIEASLFMLGFDLKCFRPMLA